MPTRTSSCNCGQLSLSLGRRCTSMSAKAARAVRLGSAAMAATASGVAAGTRSADGRLLRGLGAVPEEGLEPPTRGL